MEYLVILLDIVIHNKDSNLFLQVCFLVPRKCYVNWTNFKCQSSVQMLPGKKQVSSL